MGAMSPQVNVKKESEVEKEPMELEDFCLLKKPTETEMDNYSVDRDEIYHDTDDMS